MKLFWFFHAVLNVVRNSRKPVGWMGMKASFGRATPSTHNRAGFASQNDTPTFEPPANALPSDRTGITFFMANDSRPEVLKQEKQPFDLAVKEGFWPGRASQIAPGEVQYHTEGKERRHRFAARLGSSWKWTPPGLEPHLSCLKASGKPALGSPWKHRF